MDRCGTSGSLDIPAMPSRGACTIDVLLHADRKGKRGESPGHEENRRDVPGEALLWISSYHQVVKGRGVEGKREADRSIDAADGATGSSPWAAYQQASSRASDLSIPSTRSQDRPARTGMVCRHHVCAHETGVSVPCSNHGLVQPVRIVVGIIEFHGHCFLRDCTGKSARERNPWHLQYRPRISIYERGVYRLPKGCGDSYQHGRTRTCDRQHLHRKAVVVSQIRRPLPTRLRRWETGSKGPGSLLQVLQSGTWAFLFGKSNTGRSAWDQGGVIHLFLLQPRLPRLSKSAAAPIRAEKTSRSVGASRTPSFVLKPQDPSDETTGLEMDFDAEQALDPIQSDLSRPLAGGSLGKCPGERRLTYDNSIA